MFEFKRRTLGISFGVVMMAILALGSAGAFADGPTVTVALDSGALTETSGAVAWTTPITTLTGTVQHAIYSFPIVVNDATGSGLGWNLTITSTTFTGTTTGFPADASSITAVGITDAIGTAPVASIVAPVTYPMTLPGASATAVRFFSAQAGTGIGSSTITPTIDITIPADALADSYSSTITVASVSAP